MAIAIINTSKSTVGAKRYDMAGGGSLLLAAFMLLFQHCITDDTYTGGLTGGCLDTLLTGAGCPVQFDEHTPNFSIEMVQQEFTGPEGTFLDSLWLISDGNRYVAIYRPGQKPFIDVFAPNPREAPDTLIMPVRYHNATLLGTRLTTSNWYDKWAISGDEHSFSFSGGGDSLTLTETQRWYKTGAYKRDGYSKHAFTFRCDPKLGYVVDMDFVLETDDSTNTKPEFINFMPRDVVNPWPGESRYHYTIYTPVDRNGYFGYANNLYAGNISDEKKTTWGKGFEIKSGGFIGMIEKGAYSPALFRSGDHRFVQRTCDAWLDQHNHILLPPRDRDGMFRIRARFMFVHLPPKASKYVIDHADIDPFDDKSAVMIRLGITEDFEDQPLPLTTTTIGLTRGFWEEDFIIDSAVAWSGQRSLRIRGLPDDTLSGSKQHFIRYPQVALKPNTRYRITAMVRTAHPEVHAWISADTYEWTPYDPGRLERHKTMLINSTTWRRAQLEFKTPAFDPFIDVRFRVVGDGDAWFDDFRFHEVG